MKKPLILIIALTTSVPILAEEWSRTEINENHYQLSYHGQLVANINYSSGWQVICESRDFGSPRLLDGNLENAISVAMSECRHSFE